MINCIIEEYDYDESFYDAIPPLWELFCEIYHEVNGVKTFRMKRLKDDLQDMTSHYSAMNKSDFHEQWLSLGHFATFFFFPSDHRARVNEIIATSPIATLASQFKILPDEEVARKRLCIGSSHLEKVTRFLVDNGDLCHAITFSHDCDVLWKIACSES